MLKTIITFLGWTLAALFLLVGISGIIQGKLQVMVAVVLIIWGILCLPPLYTLTQQYGSTWNFCVRIILSILVPVFLSPFISTDELSSSIENLELFPAITAPSPTKSKASSPQPTASASAIPLSSIDSPLPILKPLSLQNAQTYAVSEATSLMAAHSPTDSVADLKQMKIIPKGGVFQVLETFKKENVPWYKVTAFDDEKRPMGIGWLNSTLLVAAQPAPALPSPTATLDVAATPGILPTPVIVLPSASTNLDTPPSVLPAPGASAVPSALPTSPAPTVSQLPKPSTVKLPSSPASPATASSKNKLPVHRVITEAVGNERRITIETDDPKASREQCLALVDKYLPQAQGKGQVIVYKPNSKPPWNGRFLAFCLNELDNKGTRINDIYDW